MRLDGGKSIEEGQFDGLSKWDDDYIGQYARLLGQHGWHIFATARLKRFARTARRHMVAWIMVHRLGAATILVRRGAATILGSRRRLVLSRWRLFFAAWACTKDAAPAGRQEQNKAANECQRSRQ
jgi:hypothetical protein